MTKYGVCCYDMNRDNKKVESLIEFDSYVEAWKCYINLLQKVYEKEYSVPKDIWFVFIEDNKIIQFEQFNIKTECKIVKL